MQEKILCIREVAEENFLSGYNCTQAVVLAFSPWLPIEKDVLLRMASSFGGGMGRLREVCGTVSAMFLVAGLLYGYDTPEMGSVKSEHYARIQALAHTFEEKNGTIVCRELLGLSVKREAPVPEARTPEYYKKRPCKTLVGDSAEILARYMMEHSPEIFSDGQK